MSLVIPTMFRLEHPKVFYFLEVHGTPLEVFPSWVIQEPRDLVRLKGPVLFPSQQQVARRGPPYLCTSTVLLVLPQGVAVEHGLPRPKDTVHLLAALVPSGLDPCTGCRGDLNLDTRSHLS